MAMVRVKVVMMRVGGVGDGGAAAPDDDDDGDVGG